MDFYARPGDGRSARLTTSTQVRPRILTTYVTLDDATGTLEAARESATYFGLARRKAEAILTEVRAAVAAWEVVARAAGAKPRECARMRSAFLF
jgi:serine/threonine-protein kinase HipA